MSGKYREGVEDCSESFRISRTVAKQVLRDGVAIMGNDVLASNSFKPTESIVASKIRSLMCVPLQVFGTKLGVIYADTTRPAAHLDEHGAEHHRGGSGANHPARHEWCHG